MIDTLARFIGSQRYDCTDEYAMQDGIAFALAGNLTSFVREAILTPTERIDFLVGDIGVECKVDGSAVATARQVFRYLSLPRLAGLILVTSRARIGVGLPREFSFGGVTKQVRVVELWRTAL